METCYEFLDCDKIDCIKRTIDDLQCWEIEDTSCHAHSNLSVQLQALVKNKVDACSSCNYYKIYHNAAET